MRRKAAIACLFLAWFCANGAVWNVVQVVAWGRMFADYSRVMPVGRALALTLDGSKPCEMCHVAQAGQDAARDQESPAALAGSDKLVLAFQVAAPVVVTAPADAWPGAVDAIGPARTDAVPVPPPRAGRA